MINLALTCLLARGAPRRAGRLALIALIPGAAVACTDSGTDGQPDLDHGTAGSPASGGSAGSAAGGGAAPGGAGGSNGGRSSSAGGPFEGGRTQALGGSGAGGSAAGAGVAGGGRSGAGSGGTSAGGRGDGGHAAGAEASGGRGGGAGAPGGSSSGAGASAGGAAGAPQSGGCGKTPTLKNSTSNSNPTPITISVAGTSREYAIRWPSSYDNTHAYRLILDLHGYGGSYKETAGENYFGLWTPSAESTIFIALSAIDTDWRNGDNLAYVDAVLKAVEADLCIDTSRIMLEGFSQGAAEVWQLACSRPGVFRAAVGHSGGGVTSPTSCMPIPYLGSGGLQENVTQTTQTDPFARWNGCTVSTLPKAPTGGHACTDYTGCPATAPVRWCNYDGPHTPLPTDSGMSSSWMPSETWPFFSQY